MDSKQDQVREFIKRQIREALLVASAETSDRAMGETVRQNATYLASQCCWHIAENYRFLELADIMEWKRTRTRR
jgi:hypothetical protein